MAKSLAMLLILFATCVRSQAIHGTSVDPNGRLSGIDGQIQGLQDQVRKAPNDYQGYDRLGSALFQKARETGDVSYFDLAEKTLEKAVSLAPQDFRAADPLIHMAMVYMGEHRFRDALDYAQRAAATGSGDVAAFAIEGDAYTDMGDYDDAASAYKAVQSVGSMTSSPLTLTYMSESRQAYLRFLHGDTQESIQLMRSAITAALQTNIHRDNLAWLFFELGERYFQAGDLENASLSYEAGIGADALHYRSIAGLAKVRAAQGRFAESIELYQRSLAIIPFPAYVEELGDVYKRIGKLKEAQQQYDLVQYIGHLDALNQVLANRELALFYADQGIKLPEALALARNELSVRHDIYTWDTLAWALYKNGRMPEAREAMDKALQLQTSDPILLFHAGMIDHALGQNSRAEAFLRKVLEINPHFHVLHAQEATQTLAEIPGPHDQESRSANAQ